MAFANGYTMAFEFNLDGLGWLYIAIATFWTIILLMGITFLISKRDLPFLRFRNVPLAVSAVATLHVYWVLCMIAYVLQGFFPCATEYWIMSIYLPLGIALFQACNTQLLQIAEVQQKFTQNLGRGGKEIDADTKPTENWPLPLARLNVKNRVKRTLTWIAYGMAVQVVVAMLVFLVSRKFHPDFGLTGVGFESYKNGTTECRDLATQYHASSDMCDAAKKIACRRGWEWIPSIFWQLLWSWCYGPYLIWRVRDIHDVHGWRRQTIYCCFVSLFATPMWLCALYVPDMYMVNRYYVPPLWFAPSIFLIEAFLIFIPCYQVLKNHGLLSETLDTIAEWESKNNGSSVSADTLQSSGKASKKPSTSSIASSRKGEILNMTALESAIRTNPQRLLLFAALKDFSGENISFLTEVLDWKRGWSPSSPSRSGFLRRPSVYEINNKALQRQQFKRAVDIYASYVSLKYSDYPVNLSHAHLKELEAIFGGAALTLHGHKIDASDSNSATPFDIPGFNFRIWPANTSTSSHDEDIESGNGTSNPKHDTHSIHSHKTQHTNNTDHSTDFILHSTSYNANKRATVLQTYEMTNTAIEQLPDFVPVPRGFGPDVFDHAEESIKYMVLTNTWPKFVNAGYASSGFEKRSFLQDVRGRFFARKS